MSSLVQHAKMQCLARMDAAGECYCRMFGGDYLCRRHAERVRVELGRFARGERTSFWPGGMTALIDEVMKDDQKPDTD